MASLVNAAPKVIFGGINDQSRGTLVREPETYPQHTPLLRLFLQTGPETTTLVDNSSGGFSAIFGEDSLARRGKFFNLQSLLLETLLAEGNPVFIKRLKPSDAPAPARIIVAIDLVRDMIPQVTTPLSGFDFPDEVQDGDVEDQEGEPVLIEGYRGRLILIANNTANVGTRVTAPGNIISTIDGAQSTIYPLFELPASFFGDGGNNLGLRLWAPTADDALPIDEATATEFKTRMYRAQFMRRPYAGGSPVTVRTAAGEDYVDICFTEGAYSRSTDKEYFAGQTLIASYEDDGFNSGTAPLYSPFGQFYLYKTFLAQVQQLLYDNELVVNPAAETTLLDKGQFDVFTGVDFAGNRYQGLVLDGAISGGLTLGQENTIYAQGGGDGTTDLAQYETLVARENLNFGELDDEYANVPVYPFGQLYDTGLSMEGKYTMMSVLGKRQDLRCIFTTYVESEQKAPTRSEELSRAQALMARLRAYPESTLYGTAVCRAEIIQQTGKLAGGGYTKPVPQVLDYAQRWARFGGAGTGILREGADIDVSPNNRIELIKDLNVEFFNERVQGDLWKAGATYSLSYDRRSQYYPAIHSVYNDDTSVLISPITVSICCDVMRMVRRIHALFSGNAKLTKEQLIEQCDNAILAAVDGRYNDRVQIVPKTYFTDDDNQRGFSWHCLVSVYANNPRTVMIFDLETRRMEDLGQ